jgi:hypothetical protein
MGRNCHDTMILQPKRPEGCKSYLLRDRLQESSRSYIRTLLFLNLAEIHNKGRAGRSANKGNRRGFMGLVLETARLAGESARKPGSNNGAVERLVEGVNHLKANIETVIAGRPRGYQSCNRNITLQRASSDRG